MKIGILGISLMAMVVAPFAVVAQQDTPDGDAGTTVQRVAVRDWTYACVTDPETGGKQCRINTKIWADAEKKSMTAAIVIVKGEGGANPILILRSGTGIDRERKLRMRVDDNTIYSIALGKCSETECRTRLTVPDVLLGEMKAGGKIRFSVPAGNGDAVVDLPFSLLGFTKGLGLLLAGG